MSTTILARILDFVRRDREREFARVWDPRGVTKVTYGDLALRASGVARRLRAAGVGRGDVVVIIARSGAPLLSAWMSPLLLGAVPSLFPWPTEKLSREYYEQSVATLLRLCGARVLVTTRDLHQTLRPLTTNAPDLREILLLEDIEVPAVPLAPAREALENPELIVVLQHSSGSTGLQKGIALSSRAILNQLANYGQALTVTPSDRVANWMPLYHDAGLIAGFLQPLLTGLRLSLLSPIDWVRDPVLLLRMISTDRSSLCWLPNFAYNFMASKIPARKLAGIDLSSIRAFVNTAEPVRASSHDRFRTRFAPYGLRPLALTTSYGTAENTLAITQSDLDRPVTIDVVDRTTLARDGRARPPRAGAATLALLSSGAPLPHTRLVVFDAGFRPRPDREVGELAIRSDCMLSGYFRRPDLTASAFHDGWYLTGDFGYTVGGEVFVTGRKTDLIITRGNNIYPQDLEFIADQVPGVHPGRTVAFGVDNEGTGTEDVVVIVELEDGADPERVEDAVRIAIARQSDCVAQTVSVVPPRWLVKTSSGKIARARCREKFLAETAAGPG